MKFIVALSVLLLALLPGAAQNAEILEKLDRVNAGIEDILSTQASHQKRLQELDKKIDKLEYEMSKPKGNYASQDDVKAVREKLNEVIKQQSADKEQTRKTIKDALEDLKKDLASVSAPKATTPPKPKTPPRVLSDEMYEYEVEAGDTFAKIAAKWNADLKEKGRAGKVTAASIQEANPNVKPEKLIAGRTKLIIPILPK